MNKEEIIKLNLNSLCVYRGIFEEKVGDKFRKLVDKLCDNSKIEECVKAYNEFTFELFKVNRILSFKEVIIDEMLLSSNPFNQSLSNFGEVPRFTEDGIFNELNLLCDIANVTSHDIKSILLNKFDSANTINSLIGWNLNEDKYIAKTEMDIERLKHILMCENNWGNRIDKIKDFHIKNGTGRSTAYKAFVWERFNDDNEGHLREILEPDPINISNLIGYETQKKEIIDNTKSFLKGLPANNLLLYGARGTGKSSTVKAVLNEFYMDGLRLIEVDKDQLRDFTRIIRLLKDKKQKFIIFVDDLVFDENEDSYSALKTILEGRVENKPDNIIIYATTNRRHLIVEKFADREEINSKDTMEEKLSLSDRFGITISFFTPDQKEFLEIIDGLVDLRGLDVDKEYVHREALKWEKWHNGRSPRSATQFIDWLEGDLSK